MGYIPVYHTCWSCGAKWNVNGAEPPAFTHLADCPALTRQGVERDADGVAFCALGPDWQPDGTTCGACGDPITASRRKWCCSKACQEAFGRNHFWWLARPHAIRLAGGRCITCWPTRHHGIVVPSGASFIIPPLPRLHPGPIEVNHIDPRRGRGYDTGCHHHQTNLEPLCRTHHLAVTSAQRAAARA